MKAFEGQEKPVEIGTNSQVSLNLVALDSPIGR
jgi:hypothetical protein